MLSGIGSIAFDNLLEPGKYMSIERQESLRNLGVMVARIRATGGTGRLALRNTVRIGMLHLYFEHGQLVHLEGTRAGTDDALIDLAGWSEGVIRFDDGVLSERQTITPAQQEFFHRTILLMQQRGVVGASPRLMPPFPAQPSSTAPLRSRARPGSQAMSAQLPVTPASGQRLPGQPDSTSDAFVPPGEIGQPVFGRPSTPLRSFSGPLPAEPSTAPLSSTAEVLLSARQWDLLVAAAHAMLESVGHLFGQRQAQNILQHVLAERSEESEVLGLLQVDRQGWLRELQAHEMLMQPVREVASAFVLLISDFERRCAALLGEEKARRMIAQALSPYQDGLAEIGIILN